MVCCNKLQGAFFAAVAAEVDLQAQQQMLTFEALLPHFRNAVRFLCTEADSACHQQRNKDIQAVIKVRVSIFIGFGEFKNKDQEILVQKLWSF